MSFSPHSYDNFKGILVYILGEKEFCCDLQSVTNILKLEDLTIVSSDFIGDNKSILYNGSKYQLINLNKVLGLKNIDLEKISRVILLDYYSQKIAFFVDKIVEIITTENLLLDNSIDMQSTVEYEYWKYLLKQNNKDIIWPDYAKLCKNARFLPGLNIKSRS